MPEKIGLVIDFGDLAPINTVALAKIGKHSIII
jgi:hypothetical protein